MVSKVQPGLFSKIIRTSILGFCLLFSEKQNTQAVLRVSSPASLKEKFSLKVSNDLPNLEGGLKESFANFGLIPYGHSMVGRLFFDKENPTACKPIDPKILKFISTHENGDGDSGPEEHEHRVPFFIADRGECSFVEKVRNIEEAGAAMAIIIDTNKDDNITRIVMTDDGSGAGIRIPSMLISYEDGQSFIDFFTSASKKELEQAYMLASFNIWSFQNNVKYDVWFSSTNEEALDFLQDFEEIDKKFGSLATMTPRYVFWECQNCEEKFKLTNCYGNGRYCATSSNSKLTGQEIIQEDLRQMCIYDFSYNQAEDRSIFWKYIRSIHDECGVDLNERCSKYAISLIEVLKFDDIQRCVDESFIRVDNGRKSPNEESWVTNNTINKLIDQDIEYWSKFGSNIVPSIVINNVTFRGQLETQAVMNALCAGIRDTPGFCTTLLHDQDLQNDLEAGIIFIDDGFKPIHVFFIFLASFFVLVIVLCFYRRYAKRQMHQTMNDTIKTAVQHYVKLKNEDKEAGIQEL